MWEDSEISESVDDTKGRWPGEMTPKGGDQGSNATGGDVIGFLNK